MENNKNINEAARSLSDEAVENVAGGSSLKKIICCTCGAEIELTIPMMSEYYNHNICPRCKGRLKTW